jgi:hypothetical protein
VIHLLVHQLYLTANDKAKPCKKATTTAFIISPRHDLKKVNVDAAVCVRGIQN